MKLINLNLLAIALVTLIFASSCGEEDNATPANAEFTFNASGLEDLGSNYAYEGWLIVDGAPVTTGVFTVDADGNPSATTFSAATEDLDAATTFVLTIEPSPDNDPAPSDVHILAGDISNGSADLSVEHPAALGTDFTSGTGTYILATPTSASMDDEKSGVWFLDPTAGPGAGLDLPTLPAGWAYEGWAVIDGTPVSTGTFLSASGADDAAPFSGTNPGPPFPGEDFVQNAPSGLSFPTDLSGGVAVISVEPVPDNSAAPFLLKPLVGAIAADALDHTPYTMDNNALNTNPTGSFNRVEQ